MRCRVIEFKLLFYVLGKIICQDLLLCSAFFDSSGTVFQIEKGESKIQKRQEFMNAVKRKVEKYANPWQQLKFQYGNAKVSNEHICVTCLLNGLFVLVCVFAHASWQQLKFQHRNAKVKSALHIYTACLQNHTAAEVLSTVGACMYVCGWSDTNLVAGQGLHRRGGSLYCMHDTSAWIWPMGGTQVRDPKVMEFPLRLVHQGELNTQTHTHTEHSWPIPQREHRWSVTQRKSILLWIQCFSTSRRYARIILGHFHMFFHDSCALSHVFSRAQSKTSVILTCI